MIFNSLRTPSIGLICHFVILPTLCLFSQGNSSSLVNLTTEEIKLEVIHAEKTCFNAYNSSKKEAFEICNDALVKSKNAGLDSFSILNLSTLISIVYYSDGPKGSYPYAKEAKLIAEKPGNSRLKPRAYYKYCLTWERFVDMESAVKLLNGAIAIAIETDDKKFEAKLISGIGFLFTAANLFEESKIYF